ncbi:MAG: hypothetical protein ACP6IY_15985 [Promethearchaeia archaeon]
MGGNPPLIKGGEKMSFLLDPGILIIFGILIALISKKFYKEDSFLSVTLSVIILLLFYIVSGSLFCELNAKDHGALGAMNENFFNLLKGIWAGYYENNPDATSCEFMFTSGEQWIKDWLINNNMDFNNLQELCAPGPQRILILCGILMFALYPVWLYLGIKIGIFLFGRQPGDKGVFGFI